VPRRKSLRRQGFELSEFHAYRMKLVIARWDLADPDFRLLITGEFNGLPPRLCNPRNEESIFALWCELKSDIMPRARRRGIRPWAATHFKN
jgi:hypothetical protein